MLTYFKKQWRQCTERAKANWHESVRIYDRDLEDAKYLPWDGIWRISCKLFLGCFAVPPMLVGLAVMPPVGAVLGALMGIIGFVLFFPVLCVLAAFLFVIVHILPSPISLCLAGSPPTLRLL